MDKYYYDRNNMPIKIGDFVQIYGGDTVGKIDEFYALEGLVLVSIKWVDGTDIPAWIKDVYKVEPEELI